MKKVYNENERNKKEMTCPLNVDDDRKPLYKPHTKSEKDLNELRVNNSGDNEGAQMGAIELTMAGT